MGADDRKARTQTPKPWMHKVPLMHKVPQMLQDTTNFQTYYKPSVVSMGPYHNGKTKLQQVEELKPMIAEQFLRITRLMTGGTLQFFNDFEKQIKEIKVKKWYDKHATKHIDEESFMRMMFVDGCFILQCMDCIVDFKVEILEMKNYLIALVKQDLFLLENQLPFPVLKVLWKLKYHVDSLEKSMLNALPYLNTNCRFTGMNLSELDQDANPLHHRELDQDADSIHLCVLDQDANPLHLLDLLRTKLLGKASRKEEKTGQGETAIKSIFFRGTIKELTAVGIHLNPNITGYITDVNFSSYGIYGRLTLPRMTIDSSTMTTFLNLIAYEVCMDNPDKFEVTSYLCFLALLIDHADDVKELRTAGILDNFLGSDQEVVGLFKEIADGLQVPDIDTYRDVKLRIQHYFSHRRRIKIASWVVEVLRDHFRSPWTTSAVLAGTIILVATVVQTYFTIFPRRDK